MAVETDIINALNAHLSGLAGVWPRAFPNVAFTPPNDGRYLRVSFQPNETETYGLSGGPYKHMGLYQVSVVTKTGGGEVASINQAAAIARHFEYLTEMSTASGTVQVTSRPTVRPGLQGENTYEVPVTIRYQLFSN